MEREVREEFHETPKEMQESWVQVEEGEGHTAAHGGGGEEVSKLLAAAAEEDPTRQLKESHHFLSKEGSYFTASKKYPQDQEYSEREERGRDSMLHTLYSRLLRGLQDLLHCLLNPVVIASHLAAFGIGICVGRRLIS